MCMLLAWLYVFYQWVGNEIQLNSGFPYFPGHLFSGGGGGMKAPKTGGWKDVKGQGGGGVGGSDQCVWGGGGVIFHWNV